LTDWSECSANCSSDSSSEKYKRNHHNGDSESMEAVDNSGFTGKKFLRRQCSCRLLTDKYENGTESNSTTPTFSEACGGFDILELPCSANCSESTNFTTSDKLHKKSDEWRTSTWPEETKDQTFTCSSLTWYQLINKENPTDWEALAVQYITAKLNIIDGCQHPDSLNNDLESAENLLDVCTWTPDDTLKAQDLQSRLRDFNQGKSTMTSRLGASTQASTHISFNTQAAPTDSSFLLVLVPTIISVTILVLAATLIFIKESSRLGKNTDSLSQAPTETRIVFDSN